MYKDDNELFSIKICKLKDKHSKIQKIYTYYMYKNLLFKLAKGAKLFKICDTDVEHAYSSPHANHWFIIPLKEILFDVLS